MFENMANSYDAASYHSWTIDAASLPHDLVVSSLDEHAEILSMRHKTLSVWGVQFHPESVLCPQGYQLIKNWFESEVLKKHMFD
jgi:anthranilate synthase component II